VSETGSSPASPEGLVRGPVRIETGCSPRSGLSEQPDECPESLWRIRCSTHPECGRGQLSTDDCWPLKASKRRWSMRLAQPVVRPESSSWMPTLRVATAPPRSKTRAVVLWSCPLS